MEVRNFREGINFKKTIRKSGPPPPPPVAGNIPAVRLKSEIGDRRPEPPLCVQNAMMTKDKKPFTYTPGGIDLSEIKSPRMARRIERNANAPGVGDIPKSPQPGYPSGPLPPSALAAMQGGLPVQVFPSGIPPPPPPPSNAPPPPPPMMPLPTKPVATNDGVFERPDMTRIIPENPMALLRKTPRPVERSFLDAVNDVNVPQNRNGAQPQYSPPHVSPQPQYSQPYSPQPQPQPAYSPQPQYSPRPQQVQSPQYNPQVQSPQYNPQVQSPQYNPQVQSPQFSPQPQVQSPQYTPQVQSPQYTPQIQSPLVQSPQVQSPQYTQQAQPQFSVQPLNRPQFYNNAQQQKSPTSNVGVLYIPPLNQSEPETPPSPPQRQPPTPQSPIPKLNAAPKPWQNQKKEQELPPWAQRSQQQQQSPPREEPQLIAPPHRVTPVQMQPPPPKPGVEVVWVTQPEVYQHPGPGAAPPPGWRGAPPPQQQQARPQQAVRQMSQQQQQQQQQPNTRIIPIQIEGQEERNMNRQQSWAPNQSNSFKVLQKMTDREEDPTVEHGPKQSQQFPQTPTEQMRKMNFGEADFRSKQELLCKYYDENPRYRGGHIPSRVFKILDESVPQGNRGPQVRTIPIQVEGDEPQTYVHPSQQSQVPEPKKYTGGAIPSRAFKMVQAMTSNALADNKQNSEINEWGYPAPPPYWQDYYPYYYPPHPNTDQNYYPPHCTPNPDNQNYYPPHCTPNPDNQNYYPPHCNPNPEVESTNEQDKSESSDSSYYQNYRESPSGEKMCSSCRSTPVPFWGYYPEPYWDPYYYSYYYGYPMYPPYSQYYPNEQPEQQDGYSSNDEMALYLSNTQSDVPNLPDNEEAINEEEIKDDASDDTIVQDEEPEEQVEEDEADSEQIEDEEADENEDEESTVSQDDTSSVYIDDDAIPHVLSVIYEESDRNSRESSVGTVFDPNEEDYDSEQEVVSVKLPLKLKFSITNGNKEVTEVTVGNSEVNSFAWGCEENDADGNRYNISDGSDDDSNITEVFVRKRDNSVCSHDDLEDDELTTTVTIPLRSRSSSKTPVVFSDKEEASQNETNYEESCSLQNEEASTTQEEEIDFWSQINQEEDVLPKRKPLCNVYRRATYSTDCDENTEKIVAEEENGNSDLQIVNGSVAMVTSTETSKISTIADDKNNKANAIVNVKTNKIITSHQNEDQLVTEVTKTTEEQRITSVKNGDVENTVDVVNYVEENLNKTDTVNIEDDCLEKVTVEDYKISNLVFEREELRETLRPPKLDFGFDECFKKIQENLKQTLGDFKPIEIEEATSEESQSLDVIKPIAVDKFDDAARLNCDMESKGKLQSLGEFQPIESEEFSAYHIMRNIRDEARIEKESSTNCEEKTDYLHKGIVQNCDKQNSDGVKSEACKAMEDLQNGYEECNGGSEESDLTEEESDDDDSDYEDIEEVSAENCRGNYEGSKMVNHESKQVVNSKVAHKFNIKKVENKCSINKNEQKQELQKNNNVEKNASLNIKGFTNNFATNNVESNSCKKLKEENKINTSKNEIKNNSNSQESDKIESKIMKQTANEEKLNIDAKNNENTKMIEATKEIKSEDDLHCEIQIRNLKEGLAEFSEDKLNFKSKDKIVPKDKSTNRRTPTSFISKNKSDADNYKQIENQEEEMDKEVSDFNNNNTQQDFYVPSIKERIRALHNASKNSHKKKRIIKEPPPCDEQKSSTKSSVKSMEESEDDIDSGVTDMSNEGEFSELNKMSKFQRAATHSRLFKLLQEDCEEEVNQLEEFNKEMKTRKEKLSLPLKTTSDYESFSSSSVNSPLSPVSDKLVNELVLSLLRKKKGKVLRNIPMEKLQAAAYKILQEDLKQPDANFLSPLRDSDQATAVQTPQEFYAGTDYGQYYETWEDYDILPSRTFKMVQDGATTGFNAKCPRVVSSKNLHQDLSQFLDTPSPPDTETSAS